MTTEKQKSQEPPTWDTETIVKVFALYLGQRGINPEAAWQPVISIDNIKAYIKYNFKLLLRPISSLSDEECIEIAKICGVEGEHFEVVRKGAEITVGVREDDDYFYDSHVVFFINGRHTDIRIDHEEYSTSLEDAIFITDYLRSIGIDLPCYLLGGKTLKEAGLAVYKEEGGV